MPPHSSRRRSLALALALVGPALGGPLGCLEDEEGDAGTADGGVPVVRLDGAIARDGSEVDPDTGVESNDDAGTVHPDAGPGPTGCALAVQPERLGFGLLERGRRAVLPVALVNSGDADCALTGVTITGAQLGLLGAAPTTVPAGATVLLDVRVDATEATSGAGELTVTRAGAAPLAVAITATGTTSAVRAHPSAVTLAQSEVACPTTRILALSATGRAARITEARLDEGSSPAITVDTSLFPADLSASGAIDLTVAYRPGAPGRDAARLLVFHEGQSAPDVIGIWADATAEATVSEAFPPLAAPLDVLFVIDDSASMVEEQDALVLAAQAMIARLVAAGVDFRIAATTTDPARGGQLVEVRGARWIDGSSPDPVAAFTALVRAVGTAGTGSEAGLEAAYSALSGAALAGVNRGFLRPEAGLAVLVMSDEEDLSPRPTRFYAQFVASLKPRQRQLPTHLSAIVLFPNDTSGCAGGGATAGRRYIEVASDSGGSIASICARDWATSLAPISTLMAGQRVHFALAGTPERRSLEVLVDGAPVTTGWAYSAIERAIRFEAPSAPPAGATVEIRYAPECR